MKRVIPIIVIAVLVFFQANTIWAASVHLTAPSDEAKWTLGREHSIQWATKGFIKKGYARLDLYKSDRRTKVATIRTKVGIKKRHCKWRLPSNLAPGYHKYAIRLKSLNGRHTSWSDNFTVRKVGSSASTKPRITPLKLHLGYLEGAMNGVLGYAHIHMNNWKKQDSYCEIKLPDYHDKKTFEIPSYKLSPPKPFRDMRFFVQNIDSEYFKAKHQKGGNYRITIGFETKYREIKGIRCKGDKDSKAPDAEMSGIHIHVDFKLKPTPDHKGLTYEFTNVKTEIRDMKMVGNWKGKLVQWLKPKAVRNARDKIEASASKKVLQTLKASGFKEKFETSIKKADKILEYARKAKVSTRHLKYRIQGDYLVVSI